MTARLNPDELDFRDHDWTLVVDSDGDLVVRNKSTGREYHFTGADSTDSNVVARMDDSGSGSSVEVQEDDAQVVGTLETLNFEDALDLTDEGNGKVTVDAGLTIEDDRSAVNVAREINLGTNLSGTDDGSGVVTFDADNGLWPESGDILVDGTDVYTDISTAASNATEYMILGPGTFSGEFEVTTGLLIRGSGREKTTIEANGDATGGSATAGVYLNANDVTVKDLSVEQLTDGNNAIRTDGDFCRFESLRMIMPGTATTHAFVNGGDGVTIDGVHVDGAGHNSIFCWANSTETHGIRISNCVVENGGLYGIRSNVANTTYIGNRVQNCSDDNIYVNGSDSLAVGNISLGSSTRDIDVTASNCAVVGNRAEIIGPEPDTSLAGNVPQADVIADTVLTLSSGSAVVSTGETTTGTHINVYLDPSGNGTNAADVKCAARAFWDNSAGEYKVEVLEDGTDVGNPDVGVKVVRA